jgi:hypothetical protein
MVSPFAKTFSLRNLSLSLSLSLYVALFSLFIDIFILIQVDGSNFD